MESHIGDGDERRLRDSAGYGARSDIENLDDNDVQFNGEELLIVR